MKNKKKEVLVPNFMLFNKTTNLNNDSEVNLRSININNINYKNPELLRQFLSEKGRIISFKITKISKGRQKLLKKAIKIARYIALLPYIKS